MVYRSRIHLRRFMRRTLHQDDPPERVARGLAAGVFAAAFPVTQLRLFLSLLFAWMVRGNKVASIVPQIFANFAVAPLLYFQLWIGAKVWPGSPSSTAMQSARKFSETWDWTNPEHSVHAFVSAFRAFRNDSGGQFLAGVLVSACAGAAISYPLCLGFLTWLRAQRLRQRAKRGIGLRPPRGRLEIPHASEAELNMNEAEVIRRYKIRMRAFVRADSVTLLNNGSAAYPEMLKAIAGANKSVDLETYILRADHTGNAFSESLCAAASRGVRARLLFDGVGALGLPHAYVETLLHAGVQVSVYRPLSSWWQRGLGPLHRRDHRKILVIDGAKAFIGGLNIADEYAAKKDGGGGWRDTHLRLQGTAPAMRLSMLFEKTWKTADLYPMPISLPPPLPVPVSVKNSSTVPLLADLTDTVSVARDVCCTSTNVLVQVLSNEEFLKRVRSRRAYIHAIRNAKRYVLIENAYFIPDRGIRRALRNAVKRGVVVAVVVALNSDVQIVGMASRALYGELLASGVRIFEYPLAMLHCKVAAIDDIWSMVSSYNLDHRSLLHNLEAGVMLQDRNFTHELCGQILADISHCREVTQQFHDARPWPEALLESMAYQFRYWL